MRLAGLRGNLRPNSFTPPEGHDPDGRGIASMCAVVDGAAGGTHAKPAEPGSQHLLGTLTHDLTDHRRHLSAVN